VSGRLDASYRLATVLLRDRHLAEEATHDAVVKAMKSARTLRDPSAFNAWFRRILVNACHEVRRKHGGNRSLPIDEAPMPALSHDPAAAWSERDALSAAMRELSPDHREVIALRFYADLPIEDIAATIGVRSGTVKSRLHRALEQLRAAYDAAGRTTREPGR
jgi:RNA polymerase sigma-70 factor (ECF subfamily)